MSTPSPPPPEESAALYYVAVQQAGRAAAETVQAAWRELDPLDLVGSWTAPGGVGDTVVNAVAAEQRAAVSLAEPYIDAVVAGDGLTSRWAGHLVQEEFWGQAADGRPLSTLLWQPLRHTQGFVDMGMPTPDALDRGLAEMIRMVVSEVNDAARGAAGVGVAANRVTTGYTRHLNPPSCARCIILAGREYAFNRGFRRHPRCDCVHLPSTRARRGRTTDPQAYFNSLTPAGQNSLLGAAAAQAVRDGASLTAVVNAQRSTATVTAHGQRLRITYDGTTRQGWFYRSEARLAQQRGRPFRPGQTPRLLPEEIYRIADDRAEAIRLLRRYGYIR